MSDKAQSGRWAVGEQVVVLEGIGGLKVAYYTRILRLTKTQVVTDNGKRWRRADGWAIPYDDLNYRYIKRIAMDAEVP